MFQLLSIIVSYGAFLLLLMPRTGAFLSTALVFMLGVGWMLYQRPLKAPSEKRKSKFSFSVSVFIAAYLGLIFYRRWLASPKVQALAAAIHIPDEAMPLMGALVLAVFSWRFIHAVTQSTVKWLSCAAEKNNLQKDLLSCLIAAITTVILTQDMIDAEILSMGLIKFAVGVLIVSAVILCLYSLIGRSIPAIAIGASVFMVISTVNVYVYSFRGRLFEPVDIFSAGTAMNVVSNYNLFPVPSRILLGWGVFAAMVMVLRHLQHKSKPDIPAGKRIALLAVCAVCSMGIAFYASNLTTYHWDKQGARYNGYVLDFVSKFKEISASEPENYDTELIAELAAQYKADSGDASAPSEQPHMIVIMDEAFSDLRAAGDFATNQEVTPFISSLKENTISGYALASVYGGNTANSEYEFLTGNSMAWLSPNAVPYQQYIRSSAYSMVSYLKSAFDYKAIAMHPYQSSGWNRPLAYEHLGFDECYFEEAFPQEDYVRDYISDQEMFEFLIDVYEAQKENPLFIFGITMQNHGEYTYSGENFTGHISLNDQGNAFPDVEQYLSLLHETDKAVEYLIDYFQNADEDVIIVFFGDHQPKVSESFYAAIGGSAGNTLDEQQKRYKVPFFVWANYDIEEKYVDCTSLNYLSTYVYEAAGIPLPPYNRFLREMEEQIPSINANGYYSLAEQRYLHFDEANEGERSWLEKHEALQYNNIFDKAHQNEELFPLLK